MIPLSREFVVDVALDRKTIEVDIPDGLLELAVERKRSQRKGGTGP